jgi:hypothetical protein
MHLSQPFFCIAEIISFNRSALSVNFSDEISNRQFILGFAKVVDFIEETGLLHKNRFPQTNFGQSIPDTLSW